jgi:hypothetical protein
VSTGLAAGFQILSFIRLSACLEGHKHSEQRVGLGPIFPSILSILCEKQIRACSTPSETAIPKVITHLSLILGIPGNGRSITREYRLQTMPWHP